MTTKAGSSAGDPARSVAKVKEAVKLKEK